MIQPPTALGAKSSVTSRLGCDHCWTPKTIWFEALGSTGIISLTYWFLTISWRRHAIATKDVPRLEATATSTTSFPTSVTPRKCNEWTCRSGGSLHIPNVVFRNCHEGSVRNPRRNLIDNVIRHHFARSRYCHAWMSRSREIGLVDNVMRDNSIASQSCHKLYSKTPEIDLVDKVIGDKFLTNRMDTILWRHNTVTNDVLRLQRPRWQYHLWQFRDAFKW